METIFAREKDFLLSPEKRNIFQAALQESGGSSSHSERAKRDMPTMYLGKSERAKRDMPTMYLGKSERAKRDMPTMYLGKKKKLRTCANMNGILGGSNAFNYVSFVLAILTLIVQTNNNINNNNNNLNQGMGQIKKHNCSVAKKNNYSLPASQVSIKFY